ncbi:hypothetical protein R1sor_012121 [Riccia sorocarpa]|uniref:Splicing factor 3A subunit 1 n=1 Tax=Riccia sorocarpa TaxID=122646 RepID=A0ABD3I6Q2_9MARC
MPGLGEVLALPAPPPGGIVGPLPTSQVTDDSQKEVENGQAPPKEASSKPASVATHTRTIGMIHPPPDVRSIVDKTAQFVARNGPEFEKRILANEKGNVKFNFLKAEDPYHAYYQHRVSEFRVQLQAPAQAPNLVAAIAAAPKPPEGGTAPTKESADSEAEAAVKPARKVLEQPEPEMYTVRLPEGLTGLDLDIIKLTAQFVARNGKNFLSGLTNREHSSPQFYFLKPTHSMFTFFTALADAYSKVLMPPKGLMDKLKRDSTDKTAVLERALHRLEWERSQERARQKAEDEIEQERLQMALIDWHDFVVVETIEFAEEEDEELPQPMTLEEVVRRSKALAMEEEEEEAAEAGKEVEMEMDVEELQLVEEGMGAASLNDGASKNSAETQQDMDIEPPMKIVKNWKRPEDRIAAEKDSTKVVVSPITGELIPINEMAEHMRISLIDPKYKEQKERMMAKLRETTLATDDEISRNIVGLARTRPDIFGTTEEEVSNAVKAEIEKKKEEPKQVIWDGHTGSISRTANQAMAQTMTLEEQIAAIHREKGNLTSDGRPLPGPAAPPGPKLAAPPQRPLPPPPGLALNIPRPLQPPNQSSTGTSTAPVPPPVQRPAILPTPQIRPATTAPTLPPPNPMLVRPPPAPISAPLPPPAGVPQYPPAPRPFAPVLPAPISMPPPPPPPSSMPPPPPPEEVPPPPPEEPEPKRQKLDDSQLIPEDQFLAQHPGPVRISVSVPSVEGEGNLKGQTLELTIQSLAETVLSVKDKIANELALPANKQKLNSHLGFLKDNLSLAYYNIGPGETLQLGLRERGGRKK